MCDTGEDMTAESGSMTGYRSLHGTTKIAVTAMFAERSDEGLRRSSVYSLAQPEGPEGLPVSPARQ